MARGAGLVNRHYHPQQVFAYTISGKWGYLEHDWVATAGDWVYEAPGEAHTLDETAEPMKVTFNVTGPLIWLDENGQATGHFDVFDYIALCKDHYEKAGFGADFNAPQAWRRPGRDAAAAYRPRGGRQPTPRARLTSAPVPRPQP